MIRVLVLSCLLMMTAFAGIAQNTQQQADFDEMLGGLLSHTVKEVKAKDLLDQKDVIYLDAREQKEYDISHIPNAKWIGYNTFKKKNVANLPKDKKIVVYCSVGYRSEKIAEKLEKMGFTNVANLYGGIFDWKHAGGMVVNNKDKETEKVHTFNKSWSQWLFKGVKVF